MSSATQSIIYSRPFAFLLNYHLKDPQFFDFGQSLKLYANHRAFIDSLRLLTVSHHRYGYRSIVDSVLYIEHTWEDLGGIIYKRKRENTALFSAIRSPAVEPLRPDRRKFAIRYRYESNRNYTRPTHINPILRLSESYRVNETRINST